MKLIVGETITRPLSFTQAQFDRFAALSGDDNPIHVDPQFAARTRFGRTVAHGMFLYANVRRALGELAQGASQAEQSLLFPAPTYTDEPLQLRLTVAEVTADGRIRVATELVKADGRFGCQGEAVLQVGWPATLPDVPAAAPEEPVEWRGLAVGQAASLRRTYTAADLAEYLDLLARPTRSSPTRPTPGPLACAAPHCPGRYWGRCSPACWAHNCRGGARTG